MSRRRVRKLLLGLVLAGTGLVAAGCGSSDKGTLIPRTDSQNLVNQYASLGQIDLTNSAGCERAQKQINNISHSISSLPSDVRSDVTGALQSGTDRTQALVAQKCSGATVTHTTTTTTTPTTATTPTTSTTTTPTTSTTTTPTTSTTPTGPDEGPPDSGDGAQVPEKKPSQEDNFEGSGSSDSGANSGGNGAEG